VPHTLWSQIERENFADMNLLEQDITFDFENELQQEADQPDQAKPVLPVGEIGQQPKNYIRNFKKARFSSFSCSIV
jgi:hypothetical protein